MIGLALEGGAARGAFHMGVIKAFLEEGYDIGGVSGTSIGALNGAILVQGAFEEGYRIWENITPSELFDIDDEEYQRFLHRKLDKQGALQLAARISQIIRNKGVDTDKLKHFLERIIDERKIRESPMDFGLVTISVTEFKPMELYKEDIPEGKMIDYLIASANFPGFKLKEIEDNYYIDGGLYDNCPINMLARKGYKEIYAVRTLGPGFFRDVKYPDIKVTHIFPSENLGKIFDFSHELVKRNLSMGYYDGLRIIRGLKGRKYCIEPVNEDLLLRALYRIPDEQINSLGKLFGFSQMESKRLMFEKILPEVGSKLGMNAKAGYLDITICLLERLAEQQGLHKYRIYTLNDFVNAVRAGKKPEIPADTGIKSTIKNKITESLTGNYKLLKAAEIIAEGMMAV